MAGAKAVEVWSVQKAGVIKTIPCESRPTSVCWLDDDNLLIGLNDGKLIWSDLVGDDVSSMIKGIFPHFIFGISTDLLKLFVFHLQPLKFEMYDSRVKGIWYQNDHLASISSKGDVTVWTLNIENQEITELCSTNIGCRPTCLTMINLADFADEYVLKREESDGETNETSVPASKKSVKNVGKVVIEEEDDDETIVIKPKEKKQVSSSMPIVYPWILISVYFTGEGE